MTKLDAGQGFKWRARYTLWLLLGFIALGIFCARLPVLAWSDQADLWIADHFVLGALLFIVALLIWAMLIPTAVPIVLAGYFFGFWLGIVVTYIATTSAFLLAFIVTRNLLREQVMGYLSQRPRTKAFIDHLESAGWQLVVWMRLSPLMPFHIQNYCYGASSMSLRTCLWSTLLGKFPGIAVTVLLGAVIKESTLGIRHFDQMERPWWWHAFLALASFAMLMVTFYLMRAGKKALRGLAIDTDDEAGEGAVAKQD